MSRGLVIAAPASGSGKTLIVMGLARALTRRGLTVRVAKSGPDFIDPGFHAAAAGAAAINLDAWAMRRETLLSLAAGMEAEADIVLCEGAMGLFDGAGPGGEAGSTAELALLTGWPVVLAIDVRGQSASVAALARGFAGHRPDLPLAGLILNRAGGTGHQAVLREALGRALPDLPILGMIQRRADLVLPERHLGLVQAAEHDDLEALIGRAADAMEEGIDIPRLLALASPGLSCPAPVSPPVPPLGQRIAIAHDTAFAFAYPAMLAGWRAAGAALSFFSPLADEAPEPEADAVFLPGGYPELHAGTLAAAANFKKGLGLSASCGAAIYGECGGYMVLGEGVIDAEGRRHEMAGLLPLVTSFAERRLHLGYREVRLAAAAPLGAEGSRFRGHEFHYSRIVAEGPSPSLFQATDARGGEIGRMGLVRGRVMGSFLHLIDRRD